MVSVAVAHREEIERTAVIPSDIKKPAARLNPFNMSKASKYPNQRDDLKRWDDEGAVSRSGYPSHEPPQAPEPKAETALYYFNIRAEDGLVDDPEGDKYPDLQAARDAAIAKARDMITEGDQIGESRRSWCVEVMDRANQQVLIVAFSQVLDPKAAD